MDTCKEPGPDLTYRAGPGPPGAMPIKAVSHGAGPGVCAFLASPWRYEECPARHSGLQGIGAGQLIVSCVPRGSCDDLTRCENLAPFRHWVSCRGACVPRGRCGQTWSNTVAAHARAIVSVRLTATGAEPVTQNADCNVLSSSSSGWGSTAAMAGDFVSCADNIPRINEYNFPIAPGGRSCVPRAQCSSLGGSGSFRTLDKPQHLSTFIAYFRRQITKALGDLPEERVRVRRVLPGGGDGTEVQFWFPEVFAHWGGGATADAPDRPALHNSSTLGYPWDSMGVLSGYDTWMPRWSCQLVPQCNSFDLNSSKCTISTHIKRCAVHQRTARIFKVVPRNVSSCVPAGVQNCSQSCLIGGGSAAACCLNTTVTVCRNGTPISAQAPDSANLIGMLSVMGLEAVGPGLGMIASGVHGVPSLFEWLPAFEAFDPQPRTAQLDSNLRWMGNTTGCVDLLRPLPGQCTGLLPSWWLSATTSTASVCKPYNGTQAQGQQNTTRIPRTAVVATADGLISSTTGLRAPIVVMVNLTGHVNASCITTDGAGTGLKFNYSSTTATITAITVTAGGYGYAAGDNITVSHLCLAGRSSDLVFELQADDITGIAKFERHGWWLSNTENGTEAHSRARCAASVMSPPPAFEGRWQRGTWHKCHRDVGCAAIANTTRCPRAAGADSAAQAQSVICVPHTVSCPEPEPEPEQPDPLPPPPDWSEIWAPRVSRATFFLVLYCTLGCTLLLAIAGTIFQVEAVRLVASWFLAVLGGWLFFLAAAVVPALLGLSDFCGGGSAVLTRLALGDTRLGWQDVPLSLLGSDQELLTLITSFYNTSLESLPPPPPYPPSPDIIAPARSSAAVDDGVFGLPVGVGVGVAAALNLSAIRSELGLGQHAGSYIRFDAELGRTVSIAPGGLALSPAGQLLAAVLLDECGLDVGARTYNGHRMQALVGVDRMASAASLLAQRGSAALMTSLRATLQVSGAVAPPLRSQLDGLERQLGTELPQALRDVASSLGCSVQTGALQAVTDAVCCDVVSALNSLFLCLFLAGLSCASLGPLLGLASGHQEMRRAVKQAAQDNEKGMSEIEEFRHFQAGGGPALAPRPPRTPPPPPPPPGEGGGRRLRRLGETKAATRGGTQVAVSAPGTPPDAPEGGGGEVSAAEPVETGGGGKRVAMLRLAARSQVQLARAQEWGEQYTNVTSEELLMC